MSDASRNYHPGTQALASITSIAGGAASLFHIANEALAFLSALFGITIGGITLFGMIKRAARRQRDVASG